MVMEMEMVLLTWDRNLLTLLLGGWVTLPGRFLRPSWNLSVIFLWGGVESQNVMAMLTTMTRHVEKEQATSILPQCFFVVVVVAEVVFQK